MSPLNFAFYILSGSVLLTSTPAASQNASQLPPAGNNMSLMHSIDAGAGRADSSEYDRRALRFETYRGTIRILQGTDGVVVGKTTWFRRLDLASIVAPSEQALSESAEFNRNRTPGMWLLTLGILTMAGDAIAVQAMHHPAPVTHVVGIAGLMLTAYGAERLDKASEALSKSLWWYNRDLRK